MRLQLVALSVLLFSCGCSDLRRAQVPDGGPERPDTGIEEGDGGPSLLRTITCDGETGDGKHRVFHQVLRYSDGSAISTCTVRGAEGIASGSGNYYYGQTGQPGGDCFLELAGASWRFTLAQDEATTIVTRRTTSTWLVQCHVYAGT